jgi:hypothetical protein
MEGLPQDQDSASDVMADAIRQITDLVERGEGPAIFEVLDSRLSNEITSTTFEELGSVLSVYVEPYVLALLTWLSQPMSRSPGARIESLDASDEVASFLRRIVGQFGPELSRASFATAQPLPYRDDWRSFDRQILRDLKSGETIIRLNLKKQNGEIAVIEGGVPSMVRFARNALRTLSALDEEVDFPERDVARLVEAWDELAPRLPDTPTPADPTNDS